MSVPSATVSFSFKAVYLLDELVPFLLEGVHLLFELVNARVFFLLLSAAVSQQRVGLFQLALHTEYKGLIIVDSHGPVPTTSVSDPHPFYEDSEPAKI